MPVLISVKQALNHLSSLLGIVLWFAYLLILNFLPQCTFFKDRNSTGLLLVGCFFSLYVKNTVFPWFLEDNRGLKNTY